MPCRAASLAVVVACLAAMQACTGGAPGSAAPAGDDNGDDVVAPEAGEAESPAEAAAPYPATAPDAPKVQSAGGTVLSTPRIVPVFFPEETQASALTDAITKYVASAEWRSATSGYGVGATTVATPVQVTASLPSTMTSDDLGAWIGSQLYDGTSAGWGPVDEPTIASTLFVLYPPTGITIYAPGEDPGDPAAATLCGPRPWDLEGWHWQSTPVPGPTAPIAFAVVGACTSGDVSLEDRMTATTSHEIAEAATDPLFLTSPAYSGVDDAHAFWEELYGGGEIGDLCAQDASDLVKPSDVGYVVQRIWSNAAASAGHDPCVPAAGAAFFDVAVDAPDSIFDPYVDVDVHGVAIPSGKSRTVDVRLFSDGPTDAWKITAVDPNAAQGGRPLLQMTLDEDSGKNGDVRHLTIRPLFTESGVTALYEIDSTLHGVTQRWYGEIVVQ